MTEVKFIRAEYDEGRMFYYWECSKCGKTYVTVMTNVKGLCKECNKAECLRRAKEKKEREERKAFEKAVKMLKRAKFLDKDIPSITINGEKYYAAKAVEDAIGTMFGERTESEDKE